MRMCMFLLLTVMFSFPKIALCIGDFGPDTCMEGFVWREACPFDHVCVPYATRDQARADNREAANRVDPRDRSFGPDTCKQGFVWREACGPNDHVCVKPAVRHQASIDNNNKDSKRKYPYCEDYALDAIKAKYKSSELYCNFSGPRWDSSKRTHFLWCLNSPDRNIEAEKSARYKELADCQTRKSSGSGTTSPPPSPVTKCCFIPGPLPGGGIGTTYTCGPQCP